MVPNLMSLGHDPPNDMGVAIYVPTYDVKGSFDIAGS
jgi:hypothetical protein